MNRRTLGLSVALLSLGGLAVAQPATACQCPNNRIPSNINEGVGATCAAAEADAYAKCHQEAEETCAGLYGDGSCAGYSLVVTTPCYWDPVECVYRVEGRIYYNCWDCCNPWEHPDGCLQNPPL
jgi:hypothetical protein